MQDSDKDKTPTLPVVTAAVPPAHVEYRMLTTEVVRLRDEFQKTDARSIEAHRIAVEALASVSALAASQVKAQQEFTGAFKSLTDVLTNIDVTIKDAKRSGRFLVTFMVLMCTLSLLAMITALAR